MTNRGITWRAGWRAATLALALGTQPALADDDKAEDYVAEVAAALGDRRLDEALALLGKADAEAKSSAMRAKVERQRAFVLVAAQRPEEALAALIRARRLDATISLGTRKPSRAQETLFACAGKLAAEGRSAPSKLEGDDLGGWLCPAATPSPATAAVVAPEPTPQPKLDPPPPPVASPTPTPAAVEPSLTTPASESAEASETEDGVPTLSWVLGGVAVASAAAGGGLGAVASSAATDRDPTTSAGGLSAGANVAFGVATATLVAGLIVWLTN